MTDGYGYMGQSDGTSEFDRHAFQRERDLATIRGGHPVKVMAVYKSDGTSQKTQGAIEPAGFVDVQPLISQVDGNGTKQDHGTIYHVPYLRHKGGNAAFIMDPVVNDIGIIVVMDRDISSLKNAIAGSGQTSQTFTPNSRRRHDFADAIYIGGLLSGTPKQYTTYTAAGGVAHGDAAGSTQSLDGAGNANLVGSTNANVQGGTNANVNGGTNTNIGAGQNMTFSSPFMFFHGAGGSGTPSISGFPAVFGVNFQFFTSSGTYFPTSGLVFAIAEVLGGGGGGGGAAGTSTSDGQGGGGGGSGAYARAILTPAQIGASQSVTVGAAGTAGVSTPATGGPGGTTSIGSLVSCPGGGGGNYMNAGSTGGFGGGGSPGGNPTIAGGVNALGIPGGPGQQGFYVFSTVTYVASGKGADTMYGFGGIPSMGDGNAFNGNGAIGYGAGGAGGVVAYTTANVSGGTGGVGLIVITEFLQ